MISACTYVGHVDYAGKYYWLKVRVVEQQTWRETRRKWLGTESGDIEAELGLRKNLRGKLIEGLRDCVQKLCDIKKKAVYSQSLF
jgi:hypothetical protein